MLFNWVKTLRLHTLLVWLLLKILGSLSWRVIWWWKCKLNFLLLWDLFFFEIEYLQIVIDQGLAARRLPRNVDLLERIATLNWWWRHRLRICKYFGLVLRLVLFKLVSAIFISSRNVDSHVVSSFMQVSLFWDFIVTRITSKWLLNLLLRNGQFFILNLGGNFQMILRKVVVQVPLCSETSTAVWGFTLVRLLASVES